MVKVFLFFFYVATAITTTVHYKNVTKHIGLKNFKDMLNSTGKLVADSFASNCHHKLIHFPYEKELFLKVR